MPITTDMHVHSHFSCDSQASIADCCEAALAKGLHRICITDHAEFNPKDEGYGFYDTAAYFASLYEAQKKYPLELLSGVEIGGGPHNYPREYEAFLAQPYDFILCSVHDWYEGLFASEMAAHPMPLEESFALYWEEVYQTVCYGGFDALAHLDFPKRYYLAAHYDWDMLEKIFDVMVQKEIALEINTSSLRKGLDEPMPGKALLDLYKKRGGQYITLGSDAHRGADIAAGFEHALSISQGLTPVYYKQRKRCVVS